jgi:hypothetical protein
MTICGENQKEVGAFYEKWHSLADDVLLQPVHQCPDSFYAGPDPDLFRLNPEVLARHLAGTPFGKKSGYLAEFLRSLREGKSFPAHRCYAGVLRVRLDPWGNVYPCLEQHVRVGSVRDGEFEAIWNSNFFNRVRNGLAGNGKCKCKCWYNNTALISHYGRILERLSIRPLFNGTRKSPAPPRN